MTILQLIFYMFSATAIFAGLMVILSPNPVRSVLFLVLAFFAMAGNWMLLHAEFLALVLVLVYVGAVMTLFLFVVMMLNIDTIRFKESFVRYAPIAVLVVLCVAGLTMMVIQQGGFSLPQMPVPAPEAIDYNNMADLGSVLYTNYALPFVVAGMLLLTAIVAAIALTHRAPERRKSQVPSEQIAVRKQDRLRLVQMPFEKKPKPNEANSL